MQIIRDIEKSIFEKVFVYVKLHLLDVKFKVMFDNEILMMIHDSQILFAFQIAVT